MAILTYGVSPSIGEAEWAILHRIESRGNWHEVVDTGTDYQTTFATGTRVVNVSAGDMAVCGVLVRNDATVQLSLAAQGGGLSRIDYIVLQIDWSGTTSSAGTIAVVQGTAAASPVAPTLSRVAGTLWQVALARVNLASGAGQLTAGMIEVCVPQRRRDLIYAAAVDQRTISNNNNVQIGSTNGVDPGWPYILRVEANVGFVDVSSGRADLSATVDGATVVSAPAGSKNEADAYVMTHTSSRTGKWAAALFAQKGGGQTEDLTTVAGISGFTVTVKPN